MTTSSAPTLAFHGGVETVVHATFADSAHADLIAAGAATVATTNTVPHSTNAIDLNMLIAEGARRSSARMEGTT